jgi:hypothetical protein
MGRLPRLFSAFEKTGLRSFFMLFFAWLPAASDALADGFPLAGKRRRSLFNPCAKPNAFVRMLVGKLGFDMPQARILPPNAFF